MVSASLSKSRSISSRSPRRFAAAMRALTSGRLFLEPVFAVRGGVSACVFRLALRPIDDSVVAFDTANRLVAACAAGPVYDAVIRGLLRAVSGGCRLSGGRIFLIDFVAVFEG